MSRRTDHAFTLLEIMIAMSLFSMIGLAVVTLMSTGVDMWLRGNRAAQQEDRVEMSLPRLAEDARMVTVPLQRDRIPFDPDDPDPMEPPPALVPENRMVSGVFDYKASDRGRVIPARYWAFVRNIVGLSELDMYVQRAGTNPEADAYIDGKSDPEEFRKNRHLPTGGMVEILWIFLPDSARPGLGTVSRAFRSPIGGKGTLLNPKNYDTLAKLDAIDPDPMFQDVLHFDLYFWTQFTTTWEFTQGDPRITQRPGRESAVKGPRPECGPSYSWDSTRGILAANVFRLSKGEGSANFSFDDIWPRRVRVEFALLEEQTFLVEGLKPGDREFRVESADFATGRGEIAGQWVKVGEEWIQIGLKEERDVFSIDLRAQWGTKEVTHAADTHVYYGRVNEFAIEIPSFRDDNN